MAEPATSPPMDPLSNCSVSSVGSGKKHTDAIDAPKAVGNVPIPTGDPTTPPTDGHCVFFDLPQELRDTIYEFAFTEENGLFTQRRAMPKGVIKLWASREDACYQETNTSEQEQDQLRFVCRQLHRETAGLGLRYNRLTFQAIKAPEHAKSETESPDQPCPLTMMTPSLVIQSRISITSLPASDRDPSGDGFDALECFEESLASYPLALQSSHIKELFVEERPRVDYDMKETIFAKIGAATSVVAFCQFHPTPHQRSHLRLGRFHQDFSLLNWLERGRLIGAVLHDDALQVIINRGFTTLITKDKVPFSCVCVCVCVCSTCKNMIAMIVKWCKYGIQRRAVGRYGGHATLGLIQRPFNNIQPLYLIPHGHDNLT
ncbi:hypothetical protein K504DRAFT_489183 [Pleomassaria siparia CBS 279.74]|uniref:Uncharacterized protein n=1 Tax=Pleomassaria siparia CBS 279.74 TaxID=1314801 RepID=A0A6G1KEM0_9PLEO|nr:hypothetical protein K504DRAFT_489183 [Pleomassaria siparia CBS 279.74]